MLDFTTATGKNEAWTLRRITSAIVQSKQVQDLYYLEYMWKQKRTVKSERNRKWSKTRVNTVDCSLGGENSDVVFKSVQTSISLFLTSGIRDETLSQCREKPTFFTTCLTQLGSDYRSFNLLRDSEHTRGGDFTDNLLFNLKRAHTTGLEKIGALHATRY